MSDFVEFRLGSGAESLDVAFPSDPTDPWGVLRCLIGTDWEAQIAVVPQSLYDQAVNGYTIPLLRAIGNPPRGKMAKLPGKKYRCELAVQQECGSAGQFCHPCFEMPTCYEASNPQKVRDPRYSQVASQVARYLAENRYVIVITSDAKA